MIHLKVEPVRSGTLESLRGIARGMIRKNTYFRLIEVVEWKIEKVSAIVKTALKR